MPPNTIKVDRSTKWGNPFVVGQDGTAERCVAQFRALLAGGVPAARPELAAKLDAYRRMLATDLPALRGRNLACWCPLDGPCHADALLEAANRPA